MLVASPGQVKGNLGKLQGAAALASSWRTKDKIAPTSGLGGVWTGVGSLAGAAP